MPDEMERIEELEERLLILEERIQRLRRQLGRRKGFTDNPLSLDTDLDDLGAVKTFLEFEELTANPDAPAPGVGRLYARGATNDAVLRWINESDEAQSVVMWQDATNQSILRGLSSATIANGTNVKTGTVTHNVGWSSVGVVLCTIQNSNVFGAGERPCTIEAYNVGANSFSFILNTHGNVGADRVVQFGWHADGVI